MTLFEKLTDHAFEKGIIVESHNYESGKKGFCMELCDNSIIFLNDSVIKDNSEKNCVLAEEIGHIETRSMLYTDEYINPEYKKWIKRKNEIIAKRWAINRLLPHKKIQDALNKGYICKNEIARECDVDPSFLDMALEYYKNKGITFSADKKFFL